MRPDWDIIAGAIILSTSLVLGFVVIVRFLRWVRAEREPLVDHRPDGHGFDPTGLRGRVEEVRRDFERAAQEVHVKTLTHEELLAATRRAIAALAYFRDHRSETQ